MSRNASRKFKKIYKSRPRKEEAVAEFQDLMTKYAETLEACKVPPEHISSWAIEPWSYNNVKECTKWIKMRLEPKLEAYLRIVNKYSPEAWQRLLLMNPSNNAFAILRKYAGEVREEWYKRPRFQDEKGRVDRVGY